LSKGRPVAVDVRLEWRKYEARDGSKRQAVEIIAETVKFLGQASTRRRSLVRAREPTSQPGLQAPCEASEDEIPFWVTARDAAAVNLVRPSARMGLPEGRGRASAAR
jgi:single-stranded DNA-binding protein